MITSKELKYVNNWANKIPMPGIEYSLEVLKEIKKCYELFNQKYKDKQYNIIFSNSDEIEFEVNSKNLCHMMGIDFRNIRGEYFDQYRQNVFNISDSNFSSYQLIEMIIDNMERVAEYDNDDNNREKAINYYKSSIKCSIFNKLSDFENFNYAAINYSEEDKKEKILFIPSNEAVTPYFMMVLKKDETAENDICVVSSLMAPEDPVQFFNNQEVIIPSQILISDNNNLKKLYASPEEKIQLLTMYSNIVNKYNIESKINIYGDYENMLNDMKNKKYILK